MFKDKEKKQRAIIWTVVALMIIGVGYWQGLRPYLVTKKCHQVALDNSGYQDDNWTTWAGSPKAQANYNFVYGVCVHKEGLGLR